MAFFDEYQQPTRSRENNLSNDRDEDEVTRLEGSSNSKPQLSVDVARERYPFCIVWTPIPGLTALLPFVGHMGIADSRGVIHDFAGPYHVSVDNLSFGATARYLPLVDLEMLSTAGYAERWDKAILDASEEYRQCMHNICCNNCHSHVAMVLNLIKYGGWTNWNMVVLATWITFCGRFVSVSRALCALLPSILLWGLMYVVLSSVSSHN